MIQNLKLRSDLNEDEFKEWLARRRREAQEIKKYSFKVIAESIGDISVRLHETTDRAFDEVEMHIAENWEPYEVERDYKHEEEAMEYLNEFIIGSLVIRSSKIGTVEEQYLNILDRIEEAGTEADIAKIVKEELELGLKSGYKDQSGYQWAMDRYALRVEEHLIVDIINSTLLTFMIDTGRELVRVPKFSDPRDACSGLQSGSGIICVVPRSEASENAQRFPNIYDPEHKYGSPDGHHGINCRHTWMAVDNLTNQPTLYDQIKRIREDFWLQRKLRHALLTAIIGA